MIRSDETISTHYLFRGCIDVSFVAFVIHSRNGVVFLLVA
jgi:hypothetical protein